MPYNFSNFLINLQPTNFQFLPNPFQTLIPAGFISDKSLPHFELAVKDATFLISSGHYFIVIGCYAVWAILVALLQNKTVNRWPRFRRFMRGVYQQRIRFGAVNECLWFCFIPFTFFGFWQLRDLRVSDSWGYLNIALSVLCWIMCLLLVVWGIFLALKYRNDM